jgi:methylenetetrahydrofolate reductase (NADPH)
VTIPVCQGTLLSSALNDLRYELVPVSSLHDEVGALPDGAHVTITSSPRMGIERTISAAEELAAKGYHVIPHLAARQISDSGQLAAIVDRLINAGVRDVMVLAGDAIAPAGPYTSALDVLRELSVMGDPFPSVGIAGYPEDHPSISATALREALLAKVPYATYIVTQLCFSPEAVSNWLHDIRADGVELPVFIGIPGKVSHKRLLGMASKVGVGDSLRFLKRNTGSMLRMVFSADFDPEYLARDLEPLMTPETGVAGFHVYTFNAITATEAWRRDMLSSLTA